MSKRKDDNYYCQKYKKLKNQLETVSSSSSDEETGNIDHAEPAITGPAEPNMTSRAGLDINDNAEPNNTDHAAPNITHHVEPDTNDHTEQDRTGRPQPDPQVILEQPSELPTSDLNNGNIEDGNQVRNTMSQHDLNQWLSALEEPMDDNPEFGANIKESISKLCLSLLKNGLVKERKDRIQKDYLIPNNCRLLQAPTLNAEISAVVPDILRDQDKDLAAVQQQLGHGISAIAKAMNELNDLAEIPKSRHYQKSFEAFKHLGNGCRILCDLHASFTQRRVKLITPSLDNSFLHVIQNTERDNTLFGNTLSEKVRHAYQSTEAPRVEPTSRYNERNRSEEYVAQEGLESHRTNAPGTSSGQPIHSDGPHGTNAPSTSIASEQHNRGDENTRPDSATQDSSSTTTYPGYEELLKQSLIRRNSPLESLPIILGRFTETALKVYDNIIRLWWQHCAESGTDVLNPSASIIISFFKKKDRGTYSATSITNRRSALGLLLGERVSKNDHVDKLVRDAKEAQRRRRQNKTVSETARIASSLEFQVQARSFTAPPREA